MQRDARSTAAHSPRLLRAAALLLAVAAMAGCATSPTGRTQLMLIPPDAAIVESAKAYLSTVRQLAKENRLLNDPILADRVEIVAGRVVAAAVSRYPHTAHWKWSVALIDDPDVNAWCMAGGRMAIHGGMFTRLRIDDHELAQIMGHEIAHAIANHTAESMSMSLATAAGLIAAGEVLDIDGPGLTVASVAAQLAITLPNSRVAESEADRIGIELASRAGYDPAAAVSLWLKMERTGDGIPIPFLSTHPAPAQRLQTLAALVPEMLQLKPRGAGPSYPVEIIY